MDFYTTSTGKYAYSTKYTYKSTKNGIVDGLQSKYKKSGCKGSAKSKTVSLPTTCSAIC